MEMFLNTNSAEARSPYLNENTFSISENPEFRRCNELCRTRLNGALIFEQMDEQENGR